MEAKNLRDGFEELRKAGVEIVGVSRDGRKAAQDFAARLSLPFPLVSDQDGAIGEAFHVPSLAGFYKRWTVLVGPDGKINHVFRDVEVQKHAQQILARIPH